MSAALKEVANAEPDELRQTILCVDDERNILSSLKRLFRKSPFDVVTANGGAEGLEVLRSQPIDLVISDMRMPEMDGAAFLTEVAHEWPSTVRILLTGFSDMEATVAAVNQGKIYRYLSKPWDENDLRITIDSGLEQARLKTERQRLMAITAKQNRELKTLADSLEEKVKARTQQLHRTFHDTVAVFSQIIDMADGQMSGHGERVSRLSIVLAKKLGLEVQTILDIRIAASLHDLGKVALPSSVTGKVRDDLSRAQLKEYKKHAAIGPGILMSLPALEASAALIRSHHERYDGSGFPDKLAGDDIPLGARIVKIANDFDNLMTGQKTGEALEKSQALNSIGNLAGKEYDPDIVERLLKLTDFELGLDAPPQAARLRKTAPELASGMTLAADLLSNEGVTLLKSGQELSAELIEKILLMETDFEHKFELFVEPATNESEDSDT